MPPKTTIFESACFNHFPDKISLPDYNPKANTDPSSGSRHYPVTSPIDGKKLMLPSVSTVMGYDPNKIKTLNAWRKRIGEEKAKDITRQSTTYGSRMHDCIECYLSNDMAELNRLYNSADFTPQLMFNQIKKFLDTYVTEVYRLEMPVYSLSLGIAGRFDCLCEMGGVPTIVDFKNSRKPKKKEYVHAYKLQSTAYAMMIEEHSGVEIPYFVIPVASFDGTLQIFTGKTSEYRDAVRKQIQKYKDEVMS